jgi:chemotaxis protein CheC
MENITENNVTSNSKMKLELIQMDALRELGNIAAAHAATALSKLLSKKILIDVTESSLHHVEGLPYALGEIDKTVFAIYMNIQEENRGIILMILPYNRAIQLSDMFFDRKQGPDRQVKEDDKEAITEIGNICVCAYLNAISKFLNVPLIPAPPGLAIDMLGAILEFPAAIIGEQSEYAIVIETKMKHRDSIFPGLILYLPDDNARNMILERFGLEQIPKVS